MFDIKYLKGERKPTILKCDNPLPLFQVKQDVRQEVQEVRQDVKQDVQDVKQDVQDVKQDVQDVKQDVQEVRQEVQEVRQDVTSKNLLLLFTQKVHSYLQNLILAINVDMSNIKHLTCLTKPYEKNGVFPHINRLHQMIG